MYCTEKLQPRTWTMLMPLQVQYWRPVDVQGTVHAAVLYTDAVIPTQHCKICQPVLHVSVQRTVIRLVLN